MFDRYARLARFKSIGSEGVKNLRLKRVAIVGLGALGAPQAETLVRSGVGSLTLIDRDDVDLTNLQRQTLYTEEDVKQHMPKAEAAKRRLQAINQDVMIEAVITDVNADNAEALLSDHDLILDGTDNFETRLIINDVSIKYQIPWIYGAATGSYGLSYTFIPEETPCFSCVYRFMPIGGETCETVGIIGPVAQLVAAVQCTEALKLLTNNKEALRTGLFYIDLWSNDVSTIDLNRVQESDCPTCVNHMFPHIQKGSGSKTAVLCGRNTVQIRPSQDAIFDYQLVAKRLRDSGLHVASNAFLTQVNLDGHRLVLFKDGRALVHGCKQINEALAIYRQYVGG